MPGSTGAKRAAKDIETIGCIRRSHSTPAAMKTWKRSQSSHAFNNDSSKMEGKQNSFHPVKRRDNLITSLTHRSMTRSVEDIQMLSSTMYPSDILEDDIAKGRNIVIGNLHALLFYGTGTTNNIEQTYIF